MLKCILIRRKLHDYSENGISEIEKSKINAHLDTCLSCRERLNQIRAVLDYAGAKNTPDVQEEFWRNFRVGLDEKLNNALVGPLILKPVRKFYLKPAFAYAVFLIFFLVMISALNRPPSVSRLQLAQGDEELVEETLTLDELDSALELNGDEDAYLEEIDLSLVLARA